MGQSRCVCYGLTIYIMALEVSFLGAVPDRGTASRKGLGTGVICRALCS